MGDKDAVVNVAMETENQPLPYDSDEDQPMNVNTPGVSNPLVALKKREEENAAEKRFVESLPPGKHIRVDIHGNIIMGKAKKTLDTKLKKPCILGFTHAVWNILNHVGCEENDLNDIDFISEVVSYAYSIWNDLRASMNAVENGVTQYTSKTTDFEYTDSKGVKRVLLVAVAKRLFVHALGRHALILRKGEEWIGTFCTFASLFANYKAQFTELRFGSTYAIKGKHVEYKRNITEGLSNNGALIKAENLCTGVNKPPHIKSALSMNVGVGANLIAARRSSKNLIVSKKYKDAASRQLKRIPHGKSIVQHFVSARNVSELHETWDLLHKYDALGQISKVTRACFPFNFILHSTKASWNPAKEGLGLTMSHLIGVSPSVNFGWAPTVDPTMAVPVWENVEKLDFSGKGFWALYNEMKDVVFTTQWDVSPDLAGKMAFLTMTGGYLDDLGISTAMTGLQFGTRTEISKIKRDTSRTKNVPFKIPNVVKCCKLSSATNINFGGATQKPNTSSHIFAGRMNYNVDPAFLESIDESIVNVGSSQNVHREIWLPACKEDLQKKKAMIEGKRGTILRGTVPWYEMATTTYDAWGTLTLMESIGKSSYWTH